MVNWTTDDGEFHSAEQPMGTKGVLNLAVESLGETGWDWHIWDRAGQVQQRYGLADTVIEAKLKAERAAAVLVQQLGLAA